MIRLVTLAVEVHMDVRQEDLVILALLSAVLFVIALMYQQPLPAIVFAALASGIAVVLRRFS
jgi:hypothetical protein